MTEYPGLDGIIKLNSNTPALDPFIIEEVYFSKLDWEIDRAIGIIKYRLANAGITDYEITLISHSDLPLTLKDIPVKEREVRTVDEDNLPPKTIYILTSKINGEPTLRPLDRIDWQEFFIQMMFGKQPKLTISPLWAQGRITWK